jgi:catechol 2,3-dioxygenase-like lactoylglutathione lyase family enzyme
MGTFPVDGMEVTHLLVVSDVDRSRSFYEHVLGAEVLPGGVRGPSVPRRHVSDPARRLRLGGGCFFRGPDGHLLEISEAKFSP